jgi:hypothetical protein
MFTESFFFDTAVGQRKNSRYPQRMGTAIRIFIGGLIILDRVLLKRMFAQSGGVASHARFPVQGENSRIYHHN